MRKFYFLVFLFSCVVFSDTLNVSVYNFPPCVIIENNKVSGFDVEIFERIAKDLDINLKYSVSDNLSNVVKSVENNNVDVGISGITITGEREAKLDFTHPYLNSGLMICVRKDSKTNFLKTVFRYMNNMSLMLLLILIFTIICGIIIFIVEKIFSKENSQFYPNNPFLGILNGFYFSNVFSSTVGFGDLVPKSIFGKIISVFMIIIGVYFIFPYAIANMNLALQEEHKIYDVSEISDLSGKVVATEKGTTSENYLKSVNCQVHSVNNIDEAFNLLESKKCDAIVFDMPVLKYYVNSKYREAINEKLVDFMRTDEYWNLYKKYFEE